MIPNVEEVLNKSLGLAESKTYSRKESEADRTERLRLDMTSNNMLAKILRPTITLSVGLVWIILHIAVMFMEIGWEALASVDSVFSACIGFYFHSRRQEKMLDKKVGASIAIEKEKVKRERIRERREFRLQKRANR